MNALVLVRPAANEDVQNHEFCTGYIERKANAPFANPQSIFTNERFDGCDVASARCTELRNRIENLLTLLFRDAVALLECRPRPDITPLSHGFSSQCLRTSSCEYNRPPARTSALAASTAACSSTVSGSSSSDAFAKARSTGSSFAARGIGQVCMPARHRASGWSEHTVTVSTLCDARAASVFDFNQRKCLATGYNDTVASPRAFKRLWMH